MKERKKERKQESTKTIKKERKKERIYNNEIKKETIKNIKL